MRISKHYAELDSGALHYRALGDAADRKVVVLIHQSPQHGGALEWAMQALAPQARVLAPDLPGYGLSDPQASPSIEGFAEVLGEWLRSLGIQRAVLYGQHTGALVAAELALRAKPKVTAVVADGYPLFSDAERTEFSEHYFPDLSPKADGSHLSALWARLQKQYRQFPWYAEAGSGFVAQQILNLVEPEPERLHQLVREILTGAAPWEGYRSVFRYQGAGDCLRAQAQPCHLLYWKGDVLALHQRRVPSDLPKQVQIQQCAEPRYWLDVVRRLLVS
jgi:pimeloyl-ACP methyl ester carboxylesterase